MKIKIFEVEKKKDITPIQHEIDIFTFAAKFLFAKKVIKAFHFRKHDITMKIEIIGHDNFPNYVSSEL